MSALSAGSVTYFQFPIQSAFLQHIVYQAASALRHTNGFNTQYRTSDIAKHLGRHPSCAQCTSHRKDFALILTVKMETRHPVQSQFGSEFPAICYHCVVMMAQSRYTWKFGGQFLRFWPLR